LHTSRHIRKDSGFSTQDEHRVLLGLEALTKAPNRRYATRSNYSVMDYTKSLNRLKMMRDIENAKLWFGHSMKQYESMGEKWHK
jgi:hypothetical protein